MVSALLKLQLQGCCHCISACACVARTSEQDELAFKLQALEDDLKQAVRSHDNVMLYFSG